MVTIKAIKGVIRDGKVELSEKLEAADGTEVVVTVPIEQKPIAEGMISFGMFSGPAEQMSTEADFREARRSIWRDADDR
jgi:hypothetical protein